jgi:hypothetical protein
MAKCLNRIIRGHGMFGSSLLQIPGLFVNT